MLSQISSPGRPASVALAVGLLSFMATPDLQAAELDADSRITAVTVFPDRAQVTRLIEVPLPRGDTTLVVSGLPANLLGDSLRVEGEGSTRLLLGAVEARTRHGRAATQEEERRLKAEIEALGDRKRLVADRIAALKFKQGVIEAIGVEFPKTKDENGASRLPDPKTWAEAWNALGEGTAQVRAEIAKEEVAARALEREIAQKQARLSQIATGQTASVEARVAVEAAAAGTATLRLTYQVPGASWRPIYDARLEARTERVTLTQLGEVRQRTGKDWSGVALTLSTARPATGARAPELAAWFVDIFEEQRYRSQQGARSEDDLMSLFKDQERKVGESSAAGEPLVAPEQEPAERNTALVAAGEFAAEYRVPGRVDLPADNSTHKVRIQERETEAALSVRAVPKLSPQAFLLAEVTYGGEDALLPGPMAVFRDGAFIGNGRLDLLRSGETFKLSFGVDDRVRVTYRLAGGQRSSEGIIAKDRRIERRYEIEVANLHQRAMRIEIQDQLPVSRDERIEVELLKATTEPTAKDLDDKTGVLAWAYDYKPGETREITFGYAIEFPEKASVYGF